MRRSSWLGVVALVAGCSSSSSHPLELPDPGLFHAVSSPPQLPCSAPDVSRDDQTLLEAETDTAAAPSGRVVVAWIAVSKAIHQVIGYRVSEDRGATWGNVQQTSMPDGLEASDPVLAVDPSGAFYLAWIGFAAQIQGTDVKIESSRVFLARLDPEKTSFGAPVDVPKPSGDVLDKPWVAVAKDGAVVVGYTRFAGGAGEGHVEIATGDGATFQTALLAPQTSGSLVLPCASSDDDRLYVVDIEESGIGLRRSDDHGATWSDPLVVSGADETLAFDDPTCVASGDHVVVSYGLTHDAPPTNGEVLDANQALYAIRVARSDDGGKTLAGVVDAHDPSAGSIFAKPRLVRHPSGAIDLAYYAGTTEGARGSLRVARSTDGGSTFAASTVVTDCLSFVSSRTSTGWLGDYAGANADDDALVLSFTENASGISHVAFRRIE